MKTFQYKIKTAQPFIVSPPGAELDLLNDQGKEGWELTAVTQNQFQITYFFKRETPSDAARYSGPG